MEKMTESFNPVYKREALVKDCVSHMLMGEEIESARVAIVVGHNAMNFVSSSDWRLVTKGGTRRVLTFSVRPQYPNFLECVAGVSYSGQAGKFCVLPDKENPRGAIVEMDGQQYVFKPGEALKIYVEPGSRFIATDCEVVYDDNNGIGERIYRIVTHEDTLYGRLDEDGCISQD